MKSARYLLVLWLLAVWCAASATAQTANALSTNNVIIYIGSFSQQAAGITSVRVTPRAWMVNGSTFYPGPPVNISRASQPTLTNNPGAYVIISNQICGVPYQVDLNGYSVWSTNYRIYATDSPDTNGNVAAGPRVGVYVDQNTFYYANLATPGGVTNGQAGVNFSGIFSGDGSGLTNLTLPQLFDRSISPNFNVVSASVFNGNGLGLTGLTAGQISGLPGTNGASFYGTNVVTGISGANHISVALTTNAAGIVATVTDSSQTNAALNILSQNNGGGLTNLSFPQKVVTAQQLDGIGTNTLVFVFEGDSFTAPNYSITSSVVNWKTTSWANMFITNTPIINTSFIYTNIAIPGKSTSAFSNDYVSYVRQWTNAAGTKWYFLMGGLNDGGLTTNQILFNITNTIAMAHADGFKVMLMLQAGVNGGALTQLAAANWYLSTNSPADITIDARTAYDNFSYVGGVGGGHPCDLDNRRYATLAWNQFAQYNNGLLNGLNTIGTTNALDLNSITLNTLTGFDGAGIGLNCPFTGANFNGTIIGVGGISQFPNAVFFLGSALYVGPISTTSDHNWQIQYAMGDQNSYNASLMGLYSGAGYGLLFLGDNNGNQGVTSIYFDTSANGTTAATRKWNIDGSGNLLPQSGGTGNIGSAGNYAGSIYATNVIGVNFAGNAASLTNLVATNQVSGVTVLSSTLTNLTVPANNNGNFVYYMTNTACLTSFAPVATTGGATLMISNGCATATNFTINAPSPAFYAMSGRTATNAISVPAGGTFFIYVKWVLNAYTNYFD